MKKEHITDIIYFHLNRIKPSAAYSAGKPSKKIFLSDWEIKKLYDKNKKEIKIPSNAIISPLSYDWIEYNNIKIIKTP